jgi:ACS family glucarate transporter-like MFS transporter
MNQPALIALPTVVRPTAVRYRVLAWFCSLSMITYIDRVCIMQVQEDMQNDLSISRGEFAWAFMSFALAYAFFEVPTGWLGDRLGPRKVLTRIVLCWLLFTALTGLVPRWDTVGYQVPFSSQFLSGSLILLLLVRFLFGAGEAGAYPNMARGAKNWFPFSERGRAQGLIWTFGRWGGAMAPILIIGLAAPFDFFQIMAGWRGAFITLGVLGVVWVIGFRYYFRDTPADHPAVNESERALIEGPAYQSAKRWPADTVEIITEKRAGTQEAASAKGLEASPPFSTAPISWSNILSSPTLWCLSFMYFCSNSGWSFFITYVTPYLKNDLKLEGVRLHLASGAPLFCGGIGCLLGGFLTDRQVRVWGRRWGRTGQGLIAYALGAGLFFAALMLTKNYGMLAFASLCLASFVKDLAMAASWSTTIDIGHRYSGTVAGVMNTVGNLGTVVSPPVVIYLVNLTGEYAVSLYYYSTMFLIASVCWLFINPTRVIVYSPADRERLERAGLLT